jgi:hypothetical protein
MTRNSRNARRNMTKSTMGWRGGFGSFVATLPRAVVSAGAATLPAVLGVYLNQVPLGFTASFGAYLVVITHPNLPAPGRARPLAATVFMLSFSAVAGAASAMQVWAFVPLAVVCATWQGWTEIADSGLRLPAAMTCAVCPITVKKALERVPGVTDAKVDFDKKTASMSADAG